MRKNLHLQNMFNRRYCFYFHKKINDINIWLYFENIYNYIFIFNILIIYKEIIFNFNYDEII